MQIRADRRIASLHEDPGCEAEAFEAAGELRRAALRTARALARVESSGIHMLRGYSNVRDYAVTRLRLSGGMASVLIAIGRRLDDLAAPRADAGDGGPAPVDGAHEGDDARDAAPVSSALDAVDGDAPNGRAPVDDGRADPGEPTIEDRLRDGSLSMANAGELDRLVRALGGLSPEEHAQWTQLAESASEWKFAQLVRKAIEEFRQGAPTVCLRLQVTEAARRDFHRARVLASRSAGVCLTEGQAFAAMARHFVRDHDKLESGEKPRRTPHTKLLPGRRYTPVAVERAVLRRAEDRCEVGDCSNDTFLQLMHIRTPHALGGSREVDDLAAGCTRHHLLHDAGVIRFVGFDKRGKPLFRTRSGRVLRRSPSGAETNRAPPPEARVLCAAEP